MHKLKLIRFSFLAAVVLGGALVGVSPVSAHAAPNNYACTGGSIPAGDYAWLTVDGSCTVDAGSVSVQHDLIVRKGGILVAAFGGSDLTVVHNLRVERDAVLVLGCEPQIFPCFNDPDQEEGTLTSHDMIGGSLTARDALAVLVHNIQIGKNVDIHGGGGGMNCDSQDALFGSPAYATVEDSVIGGHASIVGWQSCWLGFIRNTVAHNVSFNKNVTADPDGNEVVTNVISGKLHCEGNSPAPQVGDSEGSPNTVAHGASGQCTALVAP